TGPSSCVPTSSPPTQKRSSRPLRWPAGQRPRGRASLSETPDIEGPEQDAGADTLLRPADFVRDRRISGVVPLLAPDALIEELPLSEEQADVVIRGRREVHAVLDGVDDRLLAVVGPCSVHDPEATLEYAEKLAKLAREVSEELLVV